MYGVNAGVPKTLVRHLVNWVASQENDEKTRATLLDIVDHLDSTGRIKGNGIKLTACNAAYWRGDSSRQTLQRIYGVAFPKKEELDAYLKERDEALKRDHNKLGRELEYFTTVDCIGQGLPILLPKGARVIQQLQRWVEDTEEKAGYLLTKTPLTT